MAISRVLFLAISSMDAYNRGYLPGTIITGTKIGDADVYRESSILTDDNEDRRDIPAGFYAVACDTSAVSGFSVGEKTIT